MNYDHWTPQKAFKARVDREAEVEWAQKPSPAVPSMTYPKDRKWRTDKTLLSRLIP